MPRGEVEWLREAAIVSCVDSVERTERKQRLAVRGAEGSLVRRMGQGVPVGGRDGAALVEPEWGPAQGAVLSPLLGNVSLP